MTLTEKRDVSSTFAKGMAVLKSFDESQAQMTLAEVSRKTSLDAATTRRLVLTLVELGYLRKVGRTFSLTPRILVLAGSFLGANQFGRLVQPVLNRHGADLGRGIFLAMRDEHEVILVAQSSLPTTKMTFGFTVGSRLPLIQTAAGRMLLAQEEAVTVKQVVTKRDIAALTEHTECNQDAIVQSISLAARQGYCVVSEEFENGVVGIAVSVASDGNSKSVIGISDVVDSFATEAELQAVVVDLKRCALELSHSNIL